MPHEAQTFLFLSAVESAAAFDSAFVLLNFLLTAKNVIAVTTATLRMDDKEKVFILINSIPVVADEIFVASKLVCNDGYEVITPEFAICRSARYGFSMGLQRDN